MKTVPSTEFEMFWSEVLGKDWYLDEGLEDYDPEKDNEVEIDDWCLLWQGRGKPKVSSLVKHREFDEGFKQITTGLLTLFERWRGAQTHVTVNVQFVVPKEKHEELLAQLKELGGKVMAQG